LGRNKWGLSGKCIWDGRKEIQFLGDSKASIRNVIAFPKSASGKCYMTGSPTKPDESLLERYKLKIEEEDDEEFDSYER